MSDHVRVQPASGRLRISLGGTVIVDTDRALVVHEGTLPARYYVPREDVRAELADGQGAGTCPWKGRWRHLNVKAGNASIANGAWTYFETTPVCAGIRDHVAFYQDRMGAFELAG